MRGRARSLLRELAGRRLPEAIRQLPKQGFSIPAARWLRQELRPMAEGTAVRFVAAPSTGCSTDQRAQDMWQEHVSGARDHSVFLWGLMMLALWRKTAAIGSGDLGAA